MQGEPVGGRVSCCVYVFSCADGSFYTGMTHDLAHRTHHAPFTSSQIPHI